MSKTRNISKRLSQDDICNEILEVAANLGFEDDGKFLLNKQGFQKLKSSLQDMINTLGRIESAGGYVLVALCEVGITVYRLNSFTMKKGVNR